MSALNKTRESDLGPLGPLVSLSISLNRCFGPQKNRLIETVLWSTHIMFCFRNKKDNFQLQ